MKILLTGSNGQVGWELARVLPALGEVLAADRQALDLADPDAIRRAVREARPDVIVNAAAYTAVDRAESERALAMRINGEAPGILAEEAKRVGALLVHYSTDYVFDGDKPTPYTEQDVPRPLNVYGESKLAGERAIQSAACRHLILRTSWVYSHRGHNFLLTMLRLAREGKALRIVDDQHGAPTSSAMIARATAELLGPLAGGNGLYHITAAGSTTWCGFARAIFHGKGVHADVTPIAARDYPAPARRPRNSLLDNSKLASGSGVRMPSWEAGLHEVLTALVPD